MDLIKKTNIDFVTKRNTFLRASILASVIGMIIIMRCCAGSAVANRSTIAFKTAGLASTRSRMVETS